MGIAELENQIAGCNARIAELYGVGYDGEMYAPEELDEFLRYLRSFIGK